MHTITAELRTLKLGARTKLCIKLSFGSGKKPGFWVAFKTIQDDMTPAQNTKLISERHRAVVGPADPLRCCAAKFGAHWNRSALEI